LREPLMASCCNREPRESPELRKLVAGFATGVEKPRSVAAAAHFLTACPGMRRVAASR
jgi:hypothetical protein